jgi:hypothetical protein
MRICLHLLFVLATIGSLPAQGVLHKGYYISLANDTVDGSFMFAKNQSPAYSGEGKYMLHWEVRFVDSSGSENVFHLQDITAYSIGLRKTCTFMSRGKMIWTLMLRPI